MHPLMRSLAACFCLVLAGTSFAESKHSAPKAPTACAAAVPRGPSRRLSPEPVARKASTVHSAIRRAAKPQQVRAARYGCSIMATPPPPPALDITSPRTLSLANVNTDETLIVTYWSDGAYHRDALNKLNHFLRDLREAPRRKWIRSCSTSCGTPRCMSASAAPSRFSAYRSPTTNAWLASVSRGVASDSQHINGNAMDISMPGVPVFKVRQVARSLGMGAVGFYPRSGFVHIDTGPCAT